MGYEIFKSIITDAAIVMTNYKNQMFAAPDYDYFDSIEEATEYVAKEVSTIIEPIPDSTYKRQYVHVCTIPAGAAIRLDPTNAGYAIVAHPDNPPYRLNMATGQKETIEVNT